MSKSTLGCNSGQELEFGNSRESSPLPRARCIGDGDGSGGIGITVDDADEPDGIFESAIGTMESRIRPGEFVMRVLFAEFTSQAEKKIESVMLEPPVS